MFLKIWSSIIHLSGQALSMTESAAKNLLKSDTDEELTQLWNTPAHFTDVINMHLWHNQVIKLFL